jgi:hypothetical protein
LHAGDLHGVGGGGGEFGAVGVDVDAGGGVDAAVAVGALEADEGAGGLVAEQVAVGQGDGDGDGAVGGDEVVGLDAEDVADVDLPAVEGGDRDDSEGELGAFLYGAEKGGGYVFLVEDLVVFEDLEEDGDVEVGERVGGGGEVSEGKGLIIVVAR